MSRNDGADEGTKKIVLHVNNDINVDDTSIDNVKELKLGALKKFLHGIGKSIH